MKWYFIFMIVLALVMGGTMVAEKYVKAMDKPCTCIEALKEFKARVDILEKLLPKNPAMLDKPSKEGK